MDGGRHLDRDETISRKQIILTAFVNDAKISISLRLRVGYDDVNLVPFQRGLVSRIVNAHPEMTIGRAPARPLVIR